MRLLVVLLLALASLTACDRSDDVDLSGQWRLDRVVDKGRVTRIGHPHETLPSLGFGRHGGAGASDGCTWYGFHTAVDGTRITFTGYDEQRSYGPCYGFDPSHGALPKLLPMVDRAVRRGDSLVLTGPGIRLELSPPPVDPPAPPKALNIDGAWQLTHGTVRGRRIPILGTRPITLEMAYRESRGPSFGHLLTGCAHAHVKLGAGWFTVGPIHGRRACGPRSGQGQRLVVRGLAEVRRADWFKRGSTWAGIRLTGRGVSLTLRSVPYFDLSRATGSWRVVATRTAGVAGPASHQHRVPRGLATLAIHEDFTFRLATGCPPVTGTWSHTGPIAWDPITFEHRGRPCPPSVERRAEPVLAAMATGTRFHQHRDTLAIQDHDGAGLLLRRVS